MIEDNNGFEINIIYYYKAIKYLMENDPSLNKSLNIAFDFGYNLCNLDSEILASLLASEKAKEDFAKLDTEITDFFESEEQEYSN